MPENQNQENTQLNNLDYSQMTDYIENSRIDTPYGENGAGDATVNDNMSVAESLLQVANNLVIAANSIMDDEPISPDVIQNIEDSSSPIFSSIVSSNQQFQVPFNPLSPPEYAEVLDYASVQYLNGFLRTQIGKYVKVTILLGSVGTSDSYGFLVGVGTNYLILQELATGNIITLDFYSIKSVYCYYSYSPTTINPPEV